MAAGDAFTLIPSVVTPLEPDHHNTVTPSESQKKEYVNRSPTPVERWQITLNDLTSTNMAALKTHYKDQFGEYYPFAWTSVPSYIDSGATKTGRWVKGTLSITPNGKRWNCSIIFEKSN